jgi:hypothetical protein
VWLDWTLAGLAVWVVVTPWYSACFDCLPETFELIFWVCGVCLVYMFIRLLIELLTSWFSCWLITFYRNYVCWFGIML